MSLAWVFYSFFVVLVVDKVASFKIPDKYVQMAVKVLVVYVIFEAFFGMIDIFITLSARFATQ